MLCFATAVLVLLLQILSVKAEEIDISTNAKRVEYIKSLGVMLLNEEATTKEITIPQEFSDVYNKYNELQRETKFDLNAYKGKKVTIYTYNCDKERVVNLIVYKGRLIGGDISETKLHGVMKPLKE